MKMLLTVSAALAAAFLVSSLPAADTTPNDTKAVPDMNDPAMMAKMMELAQPGAQHKLLAELVGTWDYTTKMWMAPGAPPMETKGKAVREAVLGGRYFIAHASGPMEMPGADGKMQNFEFKGMSVDGYDNVKQKFVSTWIDNMGTGIMISEGTYDPASKTFTYHGTMEMVPGMKSEMRETIKVVDADHHTFSFYEMRGGKEALTMELNYTRRK